MDGQGFIRVVDAAFFPFLRALGFCMDAPSISGRFYRSSFSGPNHVISISYEPGDNAFFVLIFTIENGALSSIDDRSKTPRLADLNSKYMRTITKDERLKNEVEFSAVHVADKEEALLLKYAQELSLVLPKYLDK